MAAQSLPWTNTQACMAKSTLSFKCFLSFYEMAFCVTWGSIKRSAYGIYVRC